MSADAGRPRCSLSQKYSAAPTTNRPQMRRETPRNMTRRPSATRTALSLKVLPSASIRSKKLTIRLVKVSKISTLPVPRPRMSGAYSSSDLQQQ
ncbi:MAG TPA: hypothetical protein PK070_07470 [Synergistaceae bacterium]|nr:hypothetical protein [Synergistaceae bacterium]